MILDATAGFRNMWKTKDTPHVVFLDKRSEVKPNVVAVWGHLPFRDSCFEVIVFDPPHIVWDEKWKRSKQRQNILDSFGFWKSKRDTLPAIFKAIKEFHRVSRGRLCFKWCDTRDGRRYESFSTLFRGLWTPVFEQKRINKGFGNRYTWWVTFVRSLG